jgi:predicted nucleic acid-binding protein
MSGPLFLDTSALFASISPREARHAEARSLYEAARSARRPLVISADVFNELVTLVRSRSSAEQAVRLGEELRGDPAIQIVFVGEDIQERAWALFRRHRWPRLSLTDCATSAIMTSFRIREVFTFDEDFRKLGHATLPAPKPLLRPRALHQGAPQSRQRRSRARSIQPQ